MAITQLSKISAQEGCTRLQKKCIKGLQWINLNLNYFIPTHEEGLTGTRIKAFAELAIIYGYLEQRRGCYLDNCLLQESLLTWRTFLIQHCEHPTYAEMIRKRPPQAFYLLLPYLVLRGTGHLSSYYEDSLKRLRSWGYPQAMELVPYRLLDQQYFLWKSGWMVREPNWNRLYRQTILGRRCSSIYIDEDAAYSITHTLFYLTDFGNRLSLLGSAELNRITALVECLLVHYWRMAHWDLVGELLINLNCLGKHNSVFYVGAAKAFQRIWRRDGSIPANQACESEFGSIRSSRLSPIVFRNYYHTTLVGVLYCFTFLMAPKYDEALTFDQSKKSKYAGSALA